MVTRPFCHPRVDGWMDGGEEGARSFAEGESEAQQKKKFFSEKKKKKKKRQFWMMEECVPHCVSSSSVSSVEEERWSFGARQALSDSVSKLGPRSLGDVVQLIFGASVEIAGGDEFTVDFATIDESLCEALQAYVSSAAVSSAPQSSTAESSRHPATVVAARKKSARRVVKKNAEEEKESLAKRRKRSKFVSEVRGTLPARLEGGGGVLARRGDTYLVLKDANLSVRWQHDETLEENEVTENLATRGDCECVLAHVEGLAPEAFAEDLESIRSRLSTRHYASFVNDLRGVYEKHLAMAEDTEDFELFRDCQIFRSVFEFRCRRQTQDETSKRRRAPSRKREADVTFGKLSLRRLGLVLWAKSGNHPWWPAEVAIPTSSCLNDAFPDSPLPHHFVIYFGEHQYDLLEASFLQPFASRPAPKDAQRQAAFALALNRHKQLHYPLPLF